ncbi:keratin, type II cytoskeletal 2 epidermal-like [Macrobrachium nipponense]|uniref:keratin, type II cytoskeletal 2 epidermal-like n=1 Tax=Macrobrachium nipponense TaxID=159736 RepID=UPI0030C85F25
MFRATSLLALALVLTVAVAYPQLGGGFGQPGFGGGFGQPGFGGAGFGQPGFGGAGFGGGSPFTNAFGGPCKFWNQDPITRQYFCTERPDQTFPGAFS